MRRYYVLCKDFEVVLVVFDCRQTSLFVVVAFDVARRVVAFAVARRVVGWGHKMLLR